MLHVAYADTLLLSLSEYGCLKNRPRKFDELGALMSVKEMTSVYSGGLMYEYSNEENDFGIVDLKGSSVQKLDEFSNFQDALEKYTTPTGDGGAAKTSHAVDCPPKDADWNVDSGSIPVMPEQAQKYMKSGAGTGPGLGGDGSQQAGDSGTATASTTGGQASSTSASDDSAGSSTYGSVDRLPFIISGLALFFTMFGTLLL